jgi:signal transduction histidine kinase
MKEIQIALAQASHDDALVRNFLSVWPLVEGILEAFSKATGLPIFGFLGNTKVFQSSMDTMPPFCQAMLGAQEMERRCVADGLRRATKIEPDLPLKGNVQYCHAGMLNGRCEINTGAVGTLSILFGSKKGVTASALERRKAVIAAVQNSSLAEQLRTADETDAMVGDIDPSDMALMNAIAGVIQQLIAATVGFRSLTMNMTHELSLMMVSMGLLAREMDITMATLDARNAEGLGSELRKQSRLIVNECQLGLYVVRNFLSHTSETRYAEVVKPRFTDVDLNQLLIDVVDVHKAFAATKHITFQLSEVTLPRIVGSAMELRRLFHNVLNNAIKYSYHSTPEAQRTIKVWAKVPYDPGFSRPRFAVVIENYGLGVSADELRQVFKPGFRGQQAAAEVPIGAGIGLSEAMKIMRLHRGYIRIQSRPLHEASAGQPTYLTTVEMIFPYREGIR